MEKQSFDFEAFKKQAATRIKNGEMRCTNNSGQSICLTSQRNDWKKHEKDTEKV